MFILYVRTSKIFRFGTILLKKSLFFVHRNKSKVLRICMHLSHLKAKHTTLHSNKRWKTSKKWTKNEKSLNKSLFECIMNSWFVLNRFTWASKIVHATKQNIGNPLLIAINIFAHSHTQHIAHLCHIRNAIETSKLRKILWKYR